jgi:hypothetical protein
MYVRTKIRDMDASKSTGGKLAVGGSKTNKAVLFCHLMDVFGESLLPYLGTGVQQRVFRSGTVTRVRQPGTRLGAKRTAAKRKPTKYDLILAKLKADEAEAQATKKAHERLVFEQDRTPTYDVKYDSGYSQHSVPVSCVSKPNTMEQQDAQAAVAKTDAASGANAETKDAIVEKTRVYARCAVVEQNYLGYFL